MKWVKIHSLSLIKALDKNKGIPCGGNRSYVRYVPKYVADAYKIYIEQFQHLEVISLDDYMSTLVHIKDNDDDISNNDNSPEPDAEEPE